MRSGDWPSYRSLRPLACSAGSPIMGGSNGGVVALGPRSSSPAPGSLHYRHPSDLDDLQNPRERLSLDYRGTNPTLTP